MAKGVLDIGKPRNRAVLSWVGGGLVVLATGAWAVVTYVWPAHHGGGGDINCAQGGAIASSGNVSGATITANGTTVQAGACGGAKVP